MKLEIISIHEAGKQNQEYVKLKAKETCNLINYVITDTTYVKENTISNKLRNMYWFLSAEVAKGDYVFLRTGKGTSRIYANQAGTTTHEIFWGLDRPVWNNAGDCAVLFEIANRQVKKA